MVKLFSKNSNLCDHNHNPPTSQTDRQTDDMRSQYRALHKSASRRNQQNAEPRTTQKLLLAIRRNASANRLTALTFWNLKQITINESFMVVGEKRIALFLSDSTAVVSRPDRT